VSRRLLIGMLVRPVRERLRFPKSLEYSNWNEQSSIPRP
jgi:hypothetical protein